MEDIKNYKLKFEEMLKQNMLETENMEEEIEVKEKKKPKKTQKQIFFPLKNTFLKKSKTKK